MKTFKYRMMHINSGNIVSGFKVTPYDINGIVLADIDDIATKTIRY